jgi:hypothetical protein
MNLNKCHKCEKPGVREPLLDGTVLTCHECDVSWGYKPDIPAPAPVRPLSFDQQKANREAERKKTNDRLTRWLKREKSRKNEEEV